MKKLKPMLFTCLKGYPKEQLLKDVVAGVIVAIIALPLSIALALASGVGPEEGLYTAIVAGFLISFLGGSRVQIAGPTAAFATIVAGIVARNGMDGLMLATLLAGVFLILMGLFHFGNLYDHHRFYCRYRRNHCHRSVERLFWPDLCRRSKTDRNHGKIKSCCQQLFYHKSLFGSCGNHLSCHFDPVAKGLCKDSQIPDRWPCRDPSCKRSAPACQYHWRSLYCK